ncbi:hypothetical protein VPNG_09903 [Cytospora leucostoma]|uniref:Uncharacterized protein n=1 Tax=Cytospora leucostoma TaxID=1230097 RepID=A0A423VH29_9PEZI|nr:hypothetical protein VPNG_09903 [Cytospora leucostoma]
MSLNIAVRSVKIITSHDAAALARRGLLRPLHLTQRIHLTLLDYEDDSGLHPQAQPETSWLQVPAYLVSPETLAHAGYAAPRAWELWGRGRLAQAGDTSARAHEGVKIYEFGMFIMATFDGSPSSSSGGVSPLGPRSDDDGDWVAFLRDELRVNDEIVQQIMDKESRELARATGTSCIEMARQHAWLRYNELLGLRERSLMREKTGEGYGPSRRG